jgi:TRAP-type mannitol/chloroaromatic compound transport system substrate-binding protein
VAGIVLCQARSAALDTNPKFRINNHKKITMNRLKTIQSAMFLAAALLLVGCSGEPASSSAGIGAAEPQQRFEWKLITSWPKNLPALGTNPERFAELVGRMSGGRLTVRVYGANELVGGLEVFDAVSQGVAELGHTASYYWQGKVPGSPFFSSIPFGMTAQEMNAWLAYGGGAELWKEIYAPFGIIPVRAGNSGTQMFGWFNKEINSVADLRGLKMRIPGLGGEVLSRAGATPVTMQASEVFTALQTGALDAAEFVSAYNDLAAGYHTVADYYYYPGWHEPGSALETLINEDAYNTLPPDLQAILMAAIETMNQGVIDEITAGNAESMKRLLEEEGVELRRLPDDVLIELRRISLEVVEELADSDPMSRKVYDSYRSFQETMQAYQAVGEEAFTYARSLPPR